jgi:hypothetical protein
MVLLAQFDLSPQDVLNELARREGLSGLEEKGCPQGLNVLRTSSPLFPRSTALDNCIFCKIAAGQIPSKKIYEDEDLLAFKTSTRPRRCIS